MKILISIVTIDRDAYAIPLVYESIKKDLEKCDLFIVCRKTDIECIRIWKELHPTVVVETVPYYEIRKRHNVENICKKRNLALQYAKNCDYDYLFFIDSDIIINTNTLELLLQGCEEYKADVCSVPYQVKWLGYTATGVLKNGRFDYMKILKDSNNILYLKGGGGTGCTLIKSTVFHIPFSIAKIKIRSLWITGEDIGFFINIVKNNFLPLYITNHEIRHL